VSKRSLLFGLLLCSGSSLIACDQQSETVQLFAASSAREALVAFESEFESAHPGVNLLVQAGSSSRLRFQIDQGAGADVFLSANADQVNQLSTAALQRVPWLKNQLVLGLAKDNPAGLSQIEDLAQPGLRFVRAQDAVPAGAYAIQWIEQLDPLLAAQINANMRSMESNVRQVRAKLNLGEVDAAFLYKSDLGELQMLNAGPIVHTQMELALIKDNRLANMLFSEIQKSTIWAEFGFEATP
jgi:molybdate transport system substrate-binding protein